MQFEKGDLLNYSLIDLSDEKGRKIRAGDKFFAYNPLSIDEKCNHHIIFVHGFNNDFFDALETTFNYFEILSLTRSRNENYIGVYWPGDAHFSRAVRQADSAAINFAALMNHLIKKTKAKSPHITIIAHSLGNRISAEAILQLKAKYKISPVEKFIELAPAIDAVAYSKNYMKVPNLVKQIVVYYARTDRVLNHLYEMWNNFRRLKSGNKYEALGTFGPYGDAPNNLVKLNANSIAKTRASHGTYLTNSNLITDVAKRI